MTNSTNHTQLPWKITPQTDATRFAITDADNFHVLKINGGVVPTDCNAAFIVRAVNCHDDLVAALEAIEAANEQGNENDMAKAIAKVYAALAKARGEA